MDLRIADTARFEVITAAANVRAALDQTLICWGTTLALSNSDCEGTEDALVCTANAAERLAKSAQALSLEADALKTECQAIVRKRTGQHPDLDICTQPLKGERHA